MCASAVGSDFYERCRSPHTGTALGGFPGAGRPPAGAPESRSPGAHLPGRDGSRRVVGLEGQVQVRTASLSPL